MNIGTHGGSCGHSCCLRIQNLSVKIGNETIIEDINLHMHCGEMIALIGPNGAGKSTLIKSILGQQAYNGVISFSVPGQRNHRAKIGYVPQSPTFDAGGYLLHRPWNTRRVKFPVRFQNPYCLLNRGYLMQGVVPRP